MVLNSSLSEPSVGDSTLANTLHLLTYVPWGVEVPGNGHPAIKPDIIDEAVRGRRKQERAVGVELAKRLSAEVTIVCPRKGEGVKDIVHELTLKILEERETATKETRKLEYKTFRGKDEGMEEQERRAHLFIPRLKCWWKRAREQDEALFKLVSGFLLSK